MSFWYSINSTVSSSSTALRVSSGERLCDKRFGASFYGSALSYAIISSWAINFICTCLLRVLWVGASSLLYLIMRWAASRGYRCGVTGCSTLGGGATLGGVTVSDIFGVGGSWGVGTRPGSGNTYPTFCGSEIYTLLVCFGSAIEGIRG